MSLPWVRLDSNIGTHDKVAELLGHRDGARAFALYVASLGWCGGHGTDGHIPRHALSLLIPPIRATDKLAQLLVEVRLWEYVEGGWQVHNYAMRQELEAVTAGKRQAQRIGGAKGACVRHHGPDCGCWREQLDAAESVTYGRRSVVGLPIRSTHRST